MQIFDIGVEVTEIDDLTEEVEADMLVEQGPTSLREELEQLDYVDDLPQLEEVRLEYDGTSTLIINTDSYLFLESPSFMFSSLNLFSLWICCIKGLLHSEIHF